MRIDQRDLYPHWRFAMSLDEDLDHLSRFIEFNQANLSCYSIELARILMMASAEVDVVAKQLCESIKPGCGASKIDEYQRIICPRYGMFTESTVYAFSESLKLHPWSQWAEGNSPPWWRANNKVKHHRDTHYAEANLNNALNAVAALLILVIHVYQQPAQEGLLAPSPRVLSVGPPIIVDRLFFNQAQLTYKFGSDA